MKSPTADSTAPTVLRLPRPHPGQQKILRESKRWNVVCCGRRWGKSTLAIHRLIGPALEGDPVAYFSPSYRMLSEVWRELVRILEPVTVTSNATERRIGLVTGGVVDMWSMTNPDSARGRRYRRVVIDEAAQVGNLGHAWNAVIRPTLTDFRGAADLYSTPRGTGFFKAAFDWGQDPLTPDWASWQMPTVANPFIAPDEVEAARRQLPERVFQQEYEALFIEDSGGVFRKVSEAVDAGRAAGTPPVAGMTYSLGVDLARVADFSVLAVVDSSGRQVYFDRFNQISWERQIASILDVARRYRAHVWMDSTGVGDPPLEAVRKGWGLVSGYHFTNSSKGALIDNLAMRIEGGRVRLMDLPVQTAELLSYQYELTPSRNIRMNAPEGQNDDCVIALALACWGLAQPGPARVERAPNPLAGYRGG
jgi:hypothetical protein